MKIPIGNYLITSDEMNIVLNERKIRGKKSKNAGEEYYSPKRGEKIKNDACQT